VEYLTAFSAANRRRAFAALNYRRKLCNVSASFLFPFPASPVTDAFKKPKGRRTDMSYKKVAKPVALAVGAALAGSFAVSGVASADTGVSPFGMTTLSAGYMLGAGEGSCGGDKGDGEKAKEKAEGSCGGDKEGADKDKGAEGSCGGDKEDKGAEGSCGGDKEDKDAEGSCGGDKEDKDAEGKCGEGKCGGAV
jgi:uncharacterized low-complexity protein